MYQNNELQLSLLSNFSNAITVRLDDTNYVIWRFMLESMLVGCDLMGYIDGSIPCPPQYKITKEGSITSELTQEYKAWRKNDSALMTLLAGTLSLNALSFIVGSKTSKEVWFSLYERYAKLSKFKAFELQTSMQKIHKGKDSIDKYMERFKTVRDQLSIAGVFIPDEDIVFLILNGLPVEYATIKTVIRAQQMPISLSELRTILLDAESDIVQESRSFASAPVLKHKALPLPFLTAMIAQNGIPNGNAFINPATYGLSTGTNQINAYNGRNVVPMSHMGYVQPPASTGFIIPSSQNISMGFSGSPVSSTPGSTNFQHSFQGATMINNNGPFELQHMFQSTPIINGCVAMNQAPYVMHCTSPTVGYVNPSYPMPQPTIPQKQVVNGVSSACGFMAQYNNGNGAYLQYPNAQYTNGSNGSFTQQFGTTSDNGMTQANNVGSFSHRPMSQHNVVQSQNTRTFSGNFNSNAGNNELSPFSDVVSCYSASEKPYVSAVNKFDQVKGDHKIRDDQKAQACVPVVDVRVSAPKASSPPVSNNPSQATSAPVISVSSAKPVLEPFDEFVPCGSVSGGPFGSVSAAPTTSNNAEMDLLGSLLLAIVPSTSTPTTSEADGLLNSAPVTTFMATPPTTTMLNCRQASYPLKLWQSLPLINPD